MGNTVNTIPWQDIRLQDGRNNRFEVEHDGISVSRMVYRYLHALFLAARPVAFLYAWTLSPGGEMVIPKTTYVTRGLAHGNREIP
jgi:hypothetical protein